MDCWQSVGLEGTVVDISPPSFSVLKLPQKLLDPSFCTFAILLSCSTCLAAAFEGFAECH